MSDREWLLSTDDSLVTRARKLAEIAFAQIGGAERCGLLDSASYRLAEALDKYAAADAARAAQHSTAPEEAVAHGD